MVKGVRFEFGNGEELTIPPLSLGAIEVLENEHGEVSTWAPNVDMVCKLAGLSLKRNYPDMTDDHIKNDLLDVSNMLDVFNAVLDIGGLGRKAQEQEESAGENPPVEKK